VAFTGSTNALITISSFETFPYSLIHKMRACWLAASILVVVAAKPGPYERAEEDACPKNFAVVDDLCVAKVGPGDQVLSITLWIHSL